jgi:hypothetical protein
VEIHLPDSVGQGNAAGRQKQNGPTSVSIAEAADDRRGHELKEREEGAEKTTEKDRNERVRRTDQWAEAFDVRLLLEVENIVLFIADTHHK